MRTHIICSNTEHCPIYRNWVEETGDNRLDIIQSREIEKGKEYSCLALQALRDPITEGGIPAPEELRERISDDNFGQCLEIAFLNMLDSR